MLTNEPQILKLHWFYSKAELYKPVEDEDVTFFDCLVDVMGSKELFIGNQDTYDFADSVNRCMSSICEYSPDTVSLPPIGPQTMYARDDVQIRAIWGERRFEYVHVGIPFLLLTRP